MEDRIVFRLAGAASLLSVGSIVAAIAIGVVSGGGGPVAIDFGDPETLQSMSAAGGVSVLLSLLALIGPSVSLPAGLGWYRMLAPKASYALVGVVLWYLGMIFVIWQDAAELALVMRLPDAFASAQGARAEALLAAGELVGGMIETFIVLGDAISFLGLLLVNLALWSLGGKWRIVAAAGGAASVLIIGGVSADALAPARLPGFILFVLWMTAMGIAMLRARPAA